MCVMCATVVIIVTGRQRGMAVDSDSTIVLVAISADSTIGGLTIDATMMIVGATGTMMPRERTHLLRTCLLCTPLVLLRIRRRMEVLDSSLD
jgi:hypothetical protein